MTQYGPLANCIASGSSLRIAMETLNRSGLLICLVTDGNGRLVGTLTDGDLRRALLGGADLDALADQFMNRSPKTIPDGLTRDEIIRKMATWGVRQIPVVAAGNKLIGLASVDEMITLLQRPNRVVLMAGGLGKRLRPLTDEIPKPLLSVNGTPILEHTLRHFLSQGFSRFSLAVNYRSDMIRNHFGDGSKWGVEIDYIQETDPLGTCGALSLLASPPNEPFFVMNGDLLTQVQFANVMDFHEKQNSLATMCIREYAVEVPYGVVKVDGDKILGIEEKPRENSYINAGIYVLSPEVLSFIPKGRYFDMPSLFQALQSAGHDLHNYLVKEYWLDIGRMEDYHQAQADYEKYFASN